MAPRRWRSPSRSRPDVILMDLRMPGMGGAAAIRQLAERGSEARVLVLTTYDSDSDVVPGARGRRDRLSAQGRAARASWSARSVPPPAARPSSRRRSRRGW